MLHLYTTIYVYLVHYRLCSIESKCKLKYKFYVVTLLFIRSKHTKEVAYFQQGFLSYACYVVANKKVRF